MDAFEAGTRFFLGPDYDGHLDDSAPGEAFSTKFGVTEMTYAGALADGVVGKPWYQVQTVADVLPIYQTDFYDMNRCGEMPPCVGMVVYVDSTLMGLHEPAANLQKTLGVKQDGRIGPITLAALVRANCRSIAAQVEALDLKYLQGLPKWSLYKNGWTHREQNLLVEALKLEG
jgi:lysozyme family protein